MFWGLVLEPSKKYTQKVDQTFHISQAALDLKSCDQEPIQLVVEYENSNFVLATLSKKANIFQVPLDIIFKTGDQVSFRTIGNGKVHLSGYHVLEDLDSLMMNGEEESDLEEMEEIEDVKGKRKKSSPNLKGKKKAKLEDTNKEENEDESEEDDDDEYANTVFGKKANKKKGKVDSSLASMEDEDEDDEDEFDEGEEEEEDDDESEFEEDDLDDEEIEMEDDEELNDSEEESFKTPQSETKKKAQNGVASGTKGKNKPAQKLNKNKQPGTPGKTPQKESNKGEKGEKTPQKKGSEGLKNGEKGPKTPKSEGKENLSKTSPKKSPQGSQKKVLEGGVISEELTVGNGPVAKPGKMVNVYYVGSLATTKKQFDSVQSGPGFKFRIGRNEVIRGWDIGITGMKVGGKRRLTIPPHLAYGAKGSPPVIPPNSTLVFTVELKGLS